MKYSYWPALLGGIYYVTIWFKYWSILAEYELNMEIVQYAKFKTIWTKYWTYIPPPTIWSIYPVLREIVTNYCISSNYSFCQHYPSKNKHWLCRGLSFSITKGGKLEQHTNLPFKSQLKRGSRQQILSTIEAALRKFSTTFTEAKIL